MADGRSKRYQELLTCATTAWTASCLNAYFRMGHHPDGFRVWWHALTGSEETLDNTSSDAPWRAASAVGFAPMQKQTAFRSLTAQ
jgi:hypothetical protein